MSVTLEVMKYAAWVGVVLYARYLFRKAFCAGEAKGMAEGYSVGYCNAMDKVRNAIQHTNNLAITAQSMDDPMDAHQYTQVLQQSLIVSLGVHDAEREGWL
jgi:hypothetical protein